MHREGGGKDEQQKFHILQEVYRVTEIQEDRLNFFPFLSKWTFSTFYQHNL